MEQEKNAPSALKYMKGQVWIVDEDPVVSDLKLRYGSKLLAKRRPYVIMSYIPSVSLVWGFPTTTKIESPLSATPDEDPIFITADNKTARVVTNQLVTFDASNVRYYMYTLPDEVMIHLDKIICKRLDIGGVLRQMDETVKNLSSMSKGNGNDPIIQNITNVVNASVPTIQKIGYEHTDTNTNKPESRIERVGGKPAIVYKAPGNPDDVSPIKAAMDKLNLTAEDILNGSKDSKDEKDIPGSAGEKKDNELNDLIDRASVILGHAPSAVKYAYNIHGVKYVSWYPAIKTEIKALRDGGLMIKEIAEVYGVEKRLIHNPLYK